MPRAKTLPREPKFDLTPSGNEPLDSAVAVLHKLATHAVKNNDVASLLSEGAVHEFARVSRAWPEKVDEIVRQLPAGWGRKLMMATKASPAVPEDWPAVTQRQAAKVAPPIADFADPVAAASTIVEARHVSHGERTRHYWQGDFYEYQDSSYVALPMADVRAELYELGPRHSEKPIRKAHIDNVVDALKGTLNLSHRTVPAAPAWISSRPDDPDPRALIPLRNGLLDIDTGCLAPPTPRLFATYSLPFDFDPKAPQPVAWIAFLASVWPADPQSIEALQEWMGYLLTADTSQQKGLMIVGSPRSGKGTIGRLIIRLVGSSNVASPTLASLGMPFGLQVLIDKTVALISDARLGGRADIAAIAENILRITGEDEISVERKFKEAYTVRLMSRIVLLSNEVPVFRDAASALPSRFVILRTERSFYGEEDLALEGKLAAELPGILLWALEGLRRLRARGRFIQPAAGAESLQLMEDLASPIGAFLRERCLTEPGGQVPIKSLYEAWREWCKEHGRDSPGTEQTFGRDIAAAAPHVRIRRIRINGTRERYYEGLRLRTPDDPQEGDDDDALL